MKNKIYLLALLLLYSMGTFGQTPGWLWAKSGTGSQGDGSSDIAVDLNGNVFVTGDFFSATVSFGSITLTNADNTGTTQDIYIVKYDASGNVLWAKSSGGMAHDAGFNVSTDANGNVYMVGSFYSDSLTFGSITVTNTTMNNFSDIFIVKYDAAGNAVWAKNAPGSNNEYCNGVTSDISGNIYITGLFTGTDITFGSTVLINAGITDIFVAKYDASGNAIWARGAGGPLSDMGMDITSDVAGSVYITGFFNGASAVFGSTLLNSNGGEDIFTAKYDSSGNMLWAKSTGGTTDDQGSGITTDANGDSYITGGFKSDSIHFGGTTLINANSAGTSFDFLLVKYDSTGNETWAKSAGEFYYEIGSDITGDLTGNTYTTGYFGTPSITFESTVLTSAGSWDVFVVKYDASGNMVWATGVGGTDVEAGTGIAIGPGGYVYTTGDYRSSSLAFGSTVLPNPVNGDMYVAKLDNNTGMTEENNFFNSIYISPNPGTGEVKISCPEIINEIEITSVQGQFIYKATPNEKNVSLKIAGKGIYFVSVVTGKKRMTGKVLRY